MQYIGKTVKNKVGGMLHENKSQDRIIINNSMCSMCSINVVIEQLSVNKVFGGQYTGQDAP